MLALGRLLTLGVRPIRDKKHNLDAAVELLQRAERQILIVSGELNEDFYCNERIQQALRKAAGSGVRIRMAFGPFKDNEALGRLERLVHDYPNVELYELKVRPSRHYQLIDNSVRLQRGHPAGTAEHHTVVKENSPTVAAAYEDAFEKLIQKARLV